MKPPPPAGSPHRCDMPPPLLSPSSSSMFPAASVGDHEAAVSVSEHPCVTLVEWWLVTLEGDDEQKIAVAGTFERNQTLQAYSPAPIKKRHTQFVLETEDGTILRIHHSNSLNVARTFSNGYSKTVCEEFINGFPDWWQSCKLRYPKLTNSDTECQPCSNSRNSGVDSTQFYLEKFEQGKHLISKFHEFFNFFSRNGKPRSEDYNCDDDIAKNENAAISIEPATGDQRTPVVSLEVRGCRKETQHLSLTEKAAVDEEMPASGYLDMQNSFCVSNGTPILEEDAAAANDDNERYKAIWKEVNNMEIGLVTGSHSRERGHDEIATDVSLVHTVESTNNAVSESAGTYRKRTPVASLKSQGSWRGNQHRASNKPVGRAKKQFSPHEKRQSAIRSQGTRNAFSHVLWSPLTRGKATSLSMSTPEALNLKRSRSGRVIVPKLDEGCQSIVYGRDGFISAIIGLDSPTMLTRGESKTGGRNKRTE